MAPKHQKPQQDAKTNERTNHHLPPKHLYKSTTPPFDRIEQSAISSFARINTAGEEIILVLLVEFTLRE